MASKKKYSIDLDLDDPQRSMLHADIIKSKPFLKKLYIDWYKNFIETVPLVPDGKIIEIGSGGGFLKEILPTVITSDIMPLSNCDMTFSAEELPFENNELSAIFMVNVLHHIRNPKKFFNSAQEKLKSGGMIVMVETANSIFSRFIYKNFHHEPFNPDTGWELTEEGGPLSLSNQALPYIVFERDKKEFEKLFPSLKITSLRYHTPFRYIISGGLTREAMAPSFMFNFFTSFENFLSPINKYIGLFETIKIRRD